VNRTSRWIYAFVLWCTVALPAQAQTTIKYVHTDALGSVVAVTDQSRNIIERREYEPYGQQLTPALQDGPGYTGHLQDAATNLTYMQQRYYDPMLGVFLSVDPVTAYDQPLVAFNRYRYANNNPYSFTDPDGRESGPIRAMERDHRAYLSGKMSQQELTANRNARGIGAAAAAAVVTGGIGAAKLGAVALGNPGAANSVATAALEVGAGDALGGASLVAGAGALAKGSDAAADFFAGTKYSDKVVAQMKQGDFHDFPESVKAFQDSGSVSKITGGDGVTRDLLTIPGGYRGREGSFEFIKEGDGGINHRGFKPDNR